MAICIYPHFRTCCVFEGAVSASLGVLRTSRAFRRSLLAFALASLVMLGAWSSLVSIVGSSCTVVDVDGGVLVVGVLVDVVVGMLCVVIVAVVVVVDIIVTRFSVSSTSVLLVLSLGLPGGDVTLEFYQRQCQSSHHLGNTVAAMAVFPL